MSLGVKELLTFSFCQYSYFWEKHAVPADAINPYIHMYIYIYIYKPRALILTHINIHVL